MVNSSSDVIVSIPPLKELLVDVTHCQGTLVPFYPLVFLESTATFLCLPRLWEQLGEVGISIGSEGTE